MSSWVRVSLLVAALALSLASANRNRQRSNAVEPPPPSYAPSPQVPRSAPMDADQALGLWKSSFGAVKLERDGSRPGHLMGVWIYDRAGQEVIGFFSGPISGNILSFSWQEPTAAGAALQGGGYLQFDSRGRTFNGKWWTTNRDRGGDWNGWRAPGTAAPTPPKTGPAEQAPPVPEPDATDDYI